MRERIAPWRITQRVMQPAGADPPVPLLRIDVHRVRPAPQLGDDALDMGATRWRHLRPCRQAHGVTRGSAPMPSPRTTLSRDRKSTRLNSSHGYISYAVFCLKKKKTTTQP